MNRYVLKFKKTGYMRFISHLDLYRLFKRCIKRAQVPVAWSNGFNPHERVNLVQPLSLGFESLGEYFEIELLKDMEPGALLDAMNSFMPEGISFTGITEIPAAVKNMSAISDYALYSVEYAGDASGFSDSFPSFMAQDSIMITKKDKKTKKPVERDIKSYIRSAMLCRADEQGAEFALVLRCATNQTLNPSNLMDSFFKYCSASAEAGDLRICRRDIFFEKEGVLLPLSDIQNR